MLNFINPYYWAIKIRNSFYDKEIFKSYKLPVPVISVGNISVGGSGKTSLIRYLCEKFSHQFNIAVISRGYKRKSKGLKVIYHKGKLLENLENSGDEPYFLGKIFKKKGLNLSIVVDENRYRAGKFAVEELKANLILLDDGFQHRKIKRNIDLVLLKKEDLKEKILPFGRLREPFEALERADALILTYQDCKPFDFSYKNKPVFKLFRKNWKILNAEFKKVSEEVKDKEFIAFCGLGDNQQFIFSLKKLGIKIKKFLSFPDHYEYKNFKIKNNETYITTLKDGVKFPSYSNLYYLDFSIEVKGLESYLLEKLKNLYNTKF